MGLMDWIKVKRVPVFQLGDDDIAVFVVGPTGSGKSFFVEQVTKCGDLVKVGTSLRPCTKEVRAIRCELTEEAKTALGNATQKNIVFIDTPSFHTGHNDEAAEKEMKNWLNKSKSKSTRVGIIYMHRIETDPKFCDSIQTHLNTFALAFPQDFVTLPRRLHAVFSYEGGIPDSTIQPRRATFQEKLRTLHPSMWGKMKWATSAHPDLLRPGDSETAWNAVVELFTSSGSVAGSTSH